MDLTTMTVASVGVPINRDAKTKHQPLTAQIWRIMKLISIFLFAACITASATGSAQLITLSEKNAGLEKIFRELKKQTGYDFFYNMKTLQLAGPVSIQVKDASLDDVLNLCFKNQPLTYTITDKMVVIKEKATELVIVSDEGAKQPPIDIKGRITNTDGETVLASISVKGTQQGTTSNSEGYFELKGIDESSTLLISAISIETFEVKAATIATLMASSGGIAILTAKIKISSLNEVIVNKGYYTEKQKYSVGNVGQVTAKDIEKQPVSNPLLALQGRVPGLFITQQSGLTGGPVKIRIQGQNSIAKGNDPLIVIDGVPFYSTMPLTGNETALSPPGSDGPSPLNFINSADIESIDILKDADATAIYGSRAANGAILITTKKGKSGAAKIDVNLQHGWGKVIRTLDLLDRRQYLDMRYEALRNEGITTIPSNQYDLALWDTTHYTNWQKLLFGGTAKYTTANLSVSGGTTNIQYLVGGSFNRTTTVFPGDFHDQRGTVHFSIGGSSLNQRFKMQLSGNYMADRNLLPSADLTGNGVGLEPVAPALYNSDGTLNWAPNASGTSTWINPMSFILYKKNEIKTTNLVSNLVVSYNILPGLDVKSSAGYTNLLTTDYRSIMIGGIEPENRNVTPSPRSAQYGNRQLNSWIFEPQLNYQKNIGHGRLEGILGYTINRQESEIKTLRGVGFSNDESLRNPFAATSLSMLSLGYSLYKYNAVFGRFNYNWKKKYIVNLTARRDGSSRFGDKNKFHNFGSIGAAWILSEESFFPKNLDWLNFVKLRGSLGTTGSDQVGDYSYLTLYNNVPASAPYQNVRGLMPNGLSNSYLEWEETQKLQAGIDIGFLHDRIVLNASYSRNRSSNQLLNYPLPSITGFPGVDDNFPAKVQNTSWEFQLTTTNLKSKAVSWTSSINLTIPKNKLLAFPDLENSAYSYYLIVGKPLNIIKAFRFAGVDPITGQYQFFDSKGNIVSTPDFNTDQTKLINTLPKFYGGFQNTISYRGIELDFIWQFVKQIGIGLPFNNGTGVAPGNFITGSSNQPASVLNRWQKPGDNSNIQQFANQPFNNIFFSLAYAQSSDANYTDASYLRLKNLSLSWELPKPLQQKLQVSNFKVYLQCQNLLTITKFQGLDPESQSRDGLPPLRVITVGARFGF